MKKKYYAVIKGRKPGIYTSWFGNQGAEPQIREFKGAVYRGFLTREEAEEWMRTGKPEAAKPVVTEADPGGRIVIYTDGGSLGNPGPGGFGVVLEENGNRRELSGGYKLTTNNRMELTAVIRALEALPAPSKVLVYSDSQYVVNGMEKGWAKRWRAKNWMRNAMDKAENPDLWGLLLELCEFHDVRFSWVRGHDGNPGNERCDQLAKEAASRPDLPPDPGYRRG